MATTKTKTLDQINAMKDKAVRFLRDVVGDDDKAADFDRMSPKQYANHKGITLSNPSSSPTSKWKGGNRVAKPLTRAELQDRVAELEEENEILSDKLDSICDIADSDDEDDNEDDTDEE